MRSLVGMFIIFLSHSLTPSPPPPPLLLTSSSSPSPSPPPPPPSQGYNRKKEYIAAQGPLPDTISDFWRMIWDHNSPTVVMLTNLVEKMKVKCSLYWPPSGSTQYGNLSVTLVNTITHADFVTRQFHLKNVSLSSLHYTSQ